MSRITGTDALNMMEAYNAVYVSHEEVELTEEQVQEDFENWVNSLVEEGHDLSEYTWEDMYEEYITEIGFNPAAKGSTTRGAVTTYGANDPRRTQSGPYQSRFARPMNAGTPQTYGGGRVQQRTVRPQIGGLGGLGAGYRGAELQQTARARASQVGTPRQGTAGGPTTGGNTPIGPSPTTPVAAPARPAAAPARPAVTSTPKPTPTATTTPAATPATPATPRQRDTSITDMIGRSQIRQGAPINTGNVTSDIRSRALRGTDIGGSGGPAVKPSLQQQIRQRRLNMDLDLFDIVQGYLIDEGYAETEEAAAVIMANMSEEWKESILESGYFPTKESQMKDEAKHNLRGQAVKPRTTQTQSPKPSR